MSSKHTAIVTAASQGIGASLVEAPVNAGYNVVATSRIIKQALTGAIKVFAMEIANQGIRFNAVAPGIVDTPMHTDDPKEFLKTLQPMGKIASVKDVVGAVLFLAHAGQVTGEVLHVDGGSHAGRW